jgi:hypothetical protein
MRGVTINFFGVAPVFDFTDTVKNFDATVQNALVNLGTNIGSDPLYPDRGTYIMKDALQGAMINLQGANHSANFAAMHTMVFSKATEIPSNPFGLQNLDVGASTFNTKQLQFDIQATCVDGTKVGGANYSI